MKNNFQEMVNSLKTIAEEQHHVQDITRFILGFEI